MEPLIALSADFVEIRRQHVKQHGPFTLDVMVATSACPKCGESVAAQQLGIGTNAACGFKSLKELITTAEKLAENMAVSTAPPDCKSCGRRTKVREVQYHAYHSGLERFVVVQWKPKESLFGKPSVKLLSWDPFGPMLPLGELTSEQEQRLVQDAAFREAWAAFEIGDTQNAVGLVEEIMAAYAGDELLLRFVPLMLGRGYVRISQAIADDHSRRRPDDAEGHYWAGEVLFESIKYNVEPPSRLVEVRGSLERAVSLDSAHLPAALSLCNVLRAEKRLDEARAAFEALLQRHPACAEAHFNLAVMLLEGDPQRALAHFEAGERLAPDDADYPVGRARALVALGRAVEARQALVHARELNPSHPRLAELDAVPRS